MSIEYTIDIQLTELGFPDLVGGQETHGGQAESRPDAVAKKLHAARASGTLSNARKRNRPTRAPEGKDVDQQSANTKTRSSGSKSVTGGVEGEEEEDSEDSDVSMVGDEEDDEYEEEAIDGEEFHEGDLQGDFRCGVCDLLLTSEFKLQDHMNLHTGARPYCCAECGKRFCQISNYRAHLRTHADKKVDHLMCRVCWVGFASQAELNGHLATSHLEDRFYECDLCKRVFTSLVACETHVELHKRDAGPAAPREQEEFPCKKCGKRFASKHSLARHRKRMCLTFFRCTDCPQAFPKKSSLLRHTFSHLGLLPYTCVRCRCHFRLAKLYYRHKCEPQRIHCVACLREFPCQGDFEQHKKDTGCWGNQEPETDEVRCLECGQRFKTAGELKSHAGAHQRVLSCAECGKGFRSALLLMSHMGGHAGQSPCLCQACGIGFPHQQSYDSHLKTCGEKPLSTKARKKGTDGSSTLGSEPESGASSVPRAKTKDLIRPDAVKKIATPSAGPAEGMWKITLNQKPPPGSKILLFFPVGEDPSSNQVSVSPGTSLTPQLEPALDFSSGQEQIPVCNAALDLSKKCISSNSTPPLAHKREPEELEIAGQQEERLSGGGGAESKTNGVAETIAVETKNLEPLTVEPTLPILITDVRTEAPGAEVGAPESFQQAKREVMVEVERQGPA